jgi:predicted metal-dependent HD superfamily phosphohydrolase
MSCAEAFAWLDQSDAGKDVLKHYLGPQRQYHNLLHITEMKEHLLAAEAEGVPIADGLAAAVFVYWHDAIYITQAPHTSNEKSSAQMCKFALTTLVHPFSINRACEAILATISHQPPDAKLSPDAPLLLDCDLAILGATPERFAEYDDAIRREYWHVPERLFREKRREVLKGFYEREHIYFTPWARQRWDAQARINLKAAIQ